MSNKYPVAVHDEQLSIPFDQLPPQAGESGFGVELTQSQQEEVDRLLDQSFTSSEAFWRAGITPWSDSHTVAPPAKSAGKPAETPPGVIVRRTNNVVAEMRRNQKDKSGRNIGRTAVRQSHGRKKDGSIDRRTLGAKAQRVADKQPPNYFPYNQR